MSDPQMLIRGATVQDGRFIADSWLRSYKTANHVRKVPPEVYWKYHRSVIANLIDRSNVLVGADPQDAWTVWGWCCVEFVENTLYVHYVYVKSGFRGFKVASNLIKEVLKHNQPNAIVWTHDTKAAKKLATSLSASGVIPEGIPSFYNPYLMHSEAISA